MSTPDSQEWGGWGHWEGSVCTGCPEILLGGWGGGRGVAFSEGYSFLFFLHLIHLGPKPACPSCSSPRGWPPSPGRLESLASQEEEPTCVSFSVALFGANITTFQAVLPEEPCSPLPEEGLVTPSQRASSMPLTLGTFPLWAPRLPTLSAQGGGQRGWWRGQRSQGVWFSAGKQAAGASRSWELSCPAATAPGPYS